MRYAIAIAILCAALTTYAGTMPYPGTARIAAATTGVQTINMDRDVVTVTPTGAITFNADSSGQVGDFVTFAITTSGTTSYTITWGTGFKKTATLATGTTTARYFAVTFRCVAPGQWWEVCRTAAQT